MGYLKRLFCHSVSWLLPLVCLTAVSFASTKAYADTTPQLGTCIDSANTWCIQPATAVGWQINLKTGDVKNAAVLVGYSIVHQTGFAIGAGVYGGMGLSADGPNAPQGNLLVSLSNFGAVGIGAQHAKFPDGSVAWQGVVTFAGTLQFGGSPSYVRNQLELRPGG